MTEKYARTYLLREGDEVRETSCPGPWHTVICVEPRPAMSGGWVDVLFDDGTVMSKEPSYVWTVRRKEA